MLKLAGRTAVVTGAAGGIGRGIALALARRGCHVALADIDEAALARTAAEIAGQESARSLRVSHYRLDVANRAAVAALPAQKQYVLASAGQHGYVLLVVVVPQAPDHVAPGAAEDAGGVGVAGAAGSGAVVDVGGPGVVAAA